MGTDSKCAKSIWREFTERTTAHGIPHVKNANGICKKLLWTLVALASCVGLGYNAYLLTSAYFAYRVKVNVEVKHLNQLIFPAVTVCNHNPIRRNAFQKHSLLKAALYGVQSESTTADPVDDVITNQPRNKRELGEAGMSTSDDVINTQEPVVTEKSRGKSRSRKKTSDALETSQIEDKTDIFTTTGMATSGDVITTQEIVVTKKSRDKSRSRKKTSDTVTKSGTENYTDFFTTTEVTSEDAETLDDDVTNTTPRPDSVKPDKKKRKQLVPLTTVTTGKTVTLSAKQLKQQTKAASNALKSGNRVGKDGRRSRASFDMFKKVQIVLAEVPVEEKRLLGHELSDFILDCEFGGYECYTNESHFSSFFSNIYGNCYTFNSGWTNNDLEVTYRQGPQYGLTLIFNVDQDEYMGTIAPNAGVRVVVHPQYRMPFPEDEGISILPGQVTYVGVRLLVINRQGHPYSDCKDITINDFASNVFEEAYPVNYSTVACYKTCYQRHLMTLCHCYDSQYPDVGQAFGYVKTKPCDPVNDTDVECQAAVDISYKNNLLECYCPQACREETYQILPSSAHWPSKDFKSNLIQALADSNDRFRRVTNDKSSPDKYKENVVQLKVYYEEFNYESITESPAYKGGQLVSDLGGILGLFIGFSVLTIIEFVELGADMFVLLLWSFTRWLFHHNGVNPQSPDDENQTVTKKRRGHEYCSTSPPPPYHSRPSTAKSVHLST